MHPAIATLEKTARQFRLSGELEGSEFNRIMTCLCSVADGLSGVERRVAARAAAAVNLTEILHAAIARTSPANQRDRSVEPPLNAVMVQGPAEDLRDLLCSLVECASAVGGGPPELCTRIKQNAGDVRSKCTTEFVIPSPDLPDFLRRKLWDAARVRGGEVSIISESRLCRIEFTIPVDRRLAVSD